MGENGRLIICFSENFPYAAQDKELAEEIDALLTAHTGKRVEFDLRTFRADRPFDTQFADLKAQFPGVTIEEED